MFPLKLKKFYRFSKGDVFVLGFIGLKGSFFYRVDRIIYCLLEKQYYSSFEDVCSTIKDYSSEYIIKALNFLDDNMEFFFADSCGEVFPKELPTVTTLTLNLTYNCNLRCEYCFEGASTSNSKSMSRDIAFCAVDLFVKQLNGIRGSIILTGGEPLLQIKLIADLVDYVSAQNISFLIKTNATLLTSDIIRFFVSKGNIDLQISLDGDKKTMDQHRKFKDGVGCYDEVISTLHNIRKLFPNYYSRIAVNAVVTRVTAERLSENIEMFSQLGIKKYGFKPAMESCLSFDENARKKYVCDYYWPTTQKGVLRSGKKCCGIGYEHICVDYDGKVYPCYRFCGREEYIIGDITKCGFGIETNKRLAEIYVRDQNSECSNCYSLAVCTSGCYSDKLIENNKCDDLAKSIFDDAIEYDLMTGNKFNLLPTLSMADGR